MSTTPAFSPMPASSLPTGVSGGSSANWRRCTLDDLYEQCSDHMTEYMASSDEVGRRPRISLIRAYSPSLRPSSAHGCARSGVRAALPTVSATAATLLGSDGADSPIAAFCPVQEEPAHQHCDLRCCGEPDTDPAVVQQRAQNRDDQDGNQRAAYGAELRRDSWHDVVQDHYPEQDTDQQRTDAERGGNRLSRRDRLAADHVQRVPVEDSLHEIAQVSTPIRSALPVEHRDYPDRQHREPRDRQPLGPGDLDTGERQHQPDHCRCQRDDTAKVAAHGRPALTDHHAEADDTDSGDSRR